MPRRPYMQLYVGDLLGDTTLLSNAEFGAYMRLLCCQWTTGQPIPQDRLHRACNTSPDEFEALRPALAGYFQQDAQGAWYNRRLESELVEFHSKATERSARARKAAAARWEGGEGA